MNKIKKWIKGNTYVLNGVLNILCNPKSDYHITIAITKAGIDYNKRIVIGDDIIGSKNVKFHDPFCIIVVRKFRFMEELRKKYEGR